MRKRIKAKMSHDGRPQSGVTLIELLLAMVVTVLVAVPALGFVVMAGARQAEALIVNTETGNVGRADTQFLRDMAGSKTAISQLNSDGSPRLMSAVAACPSPTSPTGEVVFALINGSDRRVVYALADPAGDSRGGELWRRECDNTGVPGSDPFADPLLQGGTGDPVRSELIATRLDRVETACPSASSGAAQDPSCTTAAMMIVGQDTKSASPTNPADRLGIQLEASRRSNGYFPPNTPPFASFYYQPNRPERTQDVTFDASGSRDRRGENLEYQWDFGDGTPPTPFSSTPTIKRPFTSASTGGAFTVTLTVRSDPSGKTAEATREVVVTPKRPTATVRTALPLEAIKGVPFELEYELRTFDFPLASSEIDWDVDSESEPGSPVMNACPTGGNGCVDKRTYRYQETGDKRARITVTDESGATASKTVTVRVYPEAYYVSAATGEDVDDCGLVTKPCATIPFGSDRAFSDRRTHVFVADGTYAAFEPLSELTVQGGWDPNFTQVGGGTTTITGNPGLDVSYAVKILPGRQDITLSRLNIVSPALVNGSGRSSQGIVVGDGTALASNIHLDKINISGGSGKNPAGILINKGNVVMDEMTVTAPTSDSTALGSNNYGIRVVNGSDVKISGSAVTSKAAVRGVKGQDGPAGKDGIDGQQTDDRHGGAGGNGGNNGVGGLAGGLFDGTERPAGDGVGGGGGGGAGGVAKGCPWYWELCDSWGNSSYKGGKGYGSTPGGSVVARDVGGKGGSGGNGPNVVAAVAATGGSDSDVAAGVHWIGSKGANGADGATGFAGGGGSGGGSDRNDNGGGGGGGGGGGQGGRGGAGGGAGGGSFGVYAHGSRLVIGSTTVKVGSGGVGGVGGNGGPGGRGGKGSFGTSRGNGSSDPGGGGGGGGGRGGGGGSAGGGGAGGPSVGLYVNSPTVPAASGDLDITIDGPAPMAAAGGATNTNRGLNGSAGAGGAGGTGGGEGGSAATNNAVQEGTAGGAGKPGLVRARWSDS